MHGLAPFRGRTVEFCVLGPIEVLTGGRSLSFSRRQQRLIVGILSLEVNRAVSFERLIELIWGPDPPREPRAVLQTRISEARRILSSAPEWAAEVELTTYHDGYVLKADPDRVDACRFSRLLEIARTAADDDARRVLRQAVGIWRGRALGGWLTKAGADLCLSLESARLTAIEDLYDIELRAGRHYEVVDEIVGLAAANPGRERLTLQLMQALHLSGRTAEALEVYRRMRRWLKEELGLDPPAKAESLHRCILRGAAEHRRNTTVDKRTNASLSHSPTPQRPCLLPAGIADFAGREKELATVADLLTARSNESAPTTVAIDGAGGVGKTALTLHVAHRLREHFSDGQLYANLRGFGQGQPAEARDVLGRFLRALGVTAVPDDMDDRTGLYRRLLDGRKVLVVLDNAAAARQVLPLVPGSSSCAVLVNSRTRLAAELGAHAVGLDVLDPSASSILLARIGGARIHSEPQPTRELAALCGHLPLALRIAAAKLATKPHWSVQRLVDQLAETHTRLGYLSFGQMDVRSTIATSYGSLTPSAQRLLRRLGHIDLPDVTVWTAAATLDSKLDEAEELLDQLYNARLAEVGGVEPTGHARYRLHELVRLFAAARAVTEEHTDDLNRVRQRVIGCWLCLAEAAYRRVHGGDYQNALSPAYHWPLDEHIADTVVADPLRWFDADRQTIMSLIRLAADHNDSSACWRLASTASPLFQMALLHNDWADVLNLALDAAVRANDEQGQAVVQYRMGILRTGRGGPPKGQKPL